MSRVRWLVLCGAATAALLSSTYGFAASQAVASNTIGGNSAAVPRCDTDGVTIVPVISGANVSSVTVGGISANCAGGTLSVNVNNGAANSSGSGVVPAGGGSMTVALAVAVAAKDGMETDVAIAGP